MSLEKQIRNVSIWRICCRLCSSTVAFYVFSKHLRCNKLIQHCVSLATIPIYSLFLVCYEDFNCKKAEGGRRSMYALTNNMHSAGRLFPGPHIVCLKVCCTSLPSIISTIATKWREISQPKEIEKEKKRKQQPNRFGFSAIWVNACKHKFSVRYYAIFSDIRLLFGVAGIIRAVVQFCFYFVFRTLWKYMCWTQCGLRLLFRTNTSIVVAACYLAYAMEWDRQIYREIYNTLEWTRA